MIQVLVILLMIIVCIGLVMVITTIMTKRAMHQVIRILKQNGAVNPEGARTATELRLNPPSFTERLMKMRDYKPKALQLLASLGIVETLEDGRIFLSEKKLLESALTKRWPSLARGIGLR